MIFIFFRNCVNEKLKILECKKWSSMRKVRKHYKFKLRFKLVAINIFHMYVNPRPPEVFFITRPPKGGCCNPLPWFSIWNAWYPYICYQCIGMDLLYPLIPKWVPLNVIWRHCDVIKSALGNLDALKIYVKMSKNQFFAKKNVETWYFCRNFGWICKEMMSLIYITSLKHISCQIFKKWAK